MNIKKFKIAFTLIELLVVISIIAILAGIALPVFTSVQIKGQQAKDLSNARQVGLGLRLYSSDNNGYFPVADGITGTGTATSSNSAFENIVPTYIPTQKIFILSGCDWHPIGQNHPQPDPTGTGEALWLPTQQNCYAYVLGLTDSGNTSYPLVADAFSTTVGTYGSIFNTATKGGVWKGQKAIVIRVDDSATIENCTNLKVYANGANTDSSTTDIFTVGATWMNGCTVLNPN